MQDTYSTTSVFGQPCLHGLLFVHRGTVMLEQVLGPGMRSYNVTASKEVLYSSVLLTLWQQFGEETRV